MILFNALRAGYQGQVVTPAITGQLAAGSMTALVGANGSGLSLIHI